MIAGLAFGLCVVGVVAAGLVWALCGLFGCDELDGREPAPDEVLRRPCEVCRVRVADTVVVLADLVEHRVCGECADQCWPDSCFFDGEGGSGGV